MNFVFVVFKKPLRLYKYSGAPQFDPHGHVIAVKWKESTAVALAFQNCAVGDSLPGYAGILTPSLLQQGYGEELLLSVRLPGSTYHRYCVAEKQVS